METQKKKAGRTGPETNKELRVKRLELMVSPSEFSTIIQNCNNSKIWSIAEFIRQSALTTNQVKSKKQKEIEYKTLVYGVAQIGKNLNQMVKFFNTLAKEKDFDNGDILKQVHEFKVYLEDVKEITREIKP
jgi:hypothetical protein